MAVFVNAGVSTFTSGLAFSRDLRARPAGGASLQLEHRLAPRWRGSLSVGHAARGAHDLDGEISTRYVDVAPQVEGTIFTAHRFALSLMGGPVVGWARAGDVERSSFTRASGASPVSTRIATAALMMRPVEWSARLALQARMDLRVPLSGRVSFQQGLTAITVGSPAMNKQLEFSLGATVLRW